MMKPVWSLRGNRSLAGGGCRFDIKDAIGHGVIFTDCKGKQLGENDFNKEDVKKPGLVFAKMMYME